MYEKSTFLKNKEDHSPALPMLSGDEIWNRFSSLPKAAYHYGKVARYVESQNWLGRSIL